MRTFFDYLSLGNYKLPIYTDDEMPSDEIAIQDWRSVKLAKFRLRFPSEVRSVYILVHNLLFNGGDYVKGVRVFIIGEGNIKIEFKAYYNYTKEIEAALMDNAPIGIQYIVKYKGMTRSDLGYHPYRYSGK